MEKNTAALSPAEEALRDAALEYHRSPVRGKIAVTPTKPLSNQRDLSLAYSPGVAYACLAIEADPALAHDYTARGNLVGVVTNGTAVLGLGDIGPLAGKPVMEGKGCLFQKFAGIDVFDIELAERDPDKLVDIIAALEPTLGGVNLEDIKAPECFYIEKKLRERMNIPVFHDDQHGTAIISTVGADQRPGAGGQEDRRGEDRGVGRRRRGHRLPRPDGGARRQPRQHHRVRLQGRDPRPPRGQARRVEEALPEGDGHAHAGRRDGGRRRRARLLGGRRDHAPTWSSRMAAKPIILALANPEPEIRPELAKAVRPDCIIATGRSDYPNQVNNVLCFPYIFRGALDCGATRITEAMKVACVQEIADLAKAEISRRGRRRLSGPRAALRPRLPDPDAVRLAPDPAHRAGGRARPPRPRAWRRGRSRTSTPTSQSLDRFVSHTGMLMRPLFSAARQAPKRVVYAEGEDERVLRAVQIALDERLVKPILVGRPAVIAARIERAGLRLQAGRDFEVVNPEDDTRFRQYWETYHRLNARDGVTPDMAKATVRRSNTTIAALMVHLGDADALLCGLVGRFDGHFAHLREVVGQRPGSHGFATVNALLLDKHTLFIADTSVNDDPSAEQLADIAAMAVEEVRGFGLVPQVAFLSHSMFGSSQRPSAKKMRAARDLFVQRMPDVAADGELQGDAAFSEELREALLPDSTLKGAANVLICPNLDAANILFNVLKMTGGHGVTIGPILLGANAPVHVLTPSSTVRRIVNMTALAVAHAGNPPVTANA